MNIREAYSADILAIDFRPTATDPSKAIHWLENSDGARTVEINGKVAAVFGVHVLWEGVGHVWLAVDAPSASKNALALVRAGRRLVRDAMEIYSLHRLQTYVSALRPDIIRFNELIGFKGESIMYMGASDKSDVFVFAHLRSN